MFSKRAELQGVREVRTWSFPDLELRAGDESGLTLTGEASVVEFPYTVHDMFGEFTETINRGAFDKTLSENPDVVLLVNHEGLPLARTSSSTLKLSASPHLSVRADLDKSDPDVARIATKMHRGDLNEMSFAFRVTGQTWNDDYTDRQITEVNLHRGDVSVVNFGANPATNATLRADDLDVAYRAIRAGVASPDQITQIATMLANLIDSADDTMDHLLTALGIPDPDAADDATETNSAFADEARWFLEMQMRVLERSRN